jgi:GGDEF domain-containing protein
MTAPTDRNPLPACERWDRFPAPQRGVWCTSLRDDPITGLIAWPQFEYTLPDLLRDAVRDGRTVGLAIGDCDDFKAFVERERAVDPRTWGHLVGNKVMADLGRLARCWLDRLDERIRAAALATFGGDEIVIVADVTDGPAFGAVVAELRDLFRIFLPVTVSFAYATLDRTTLPAATSGDAWPAEWMAHVVGSVDRKLFAAKHARRDQKADIPPGFLISADAGPKDPAR